MGGCCCWPYRIVMIKWVNLGKTPAHCRCSLSSSEAGGGDSRNVAKLRSPQVVWGDWSVGCVWKMGGRGWNWRSQPELTYCDSPSTAQGYVDTSNNWRTSRYPQVCSWKSVLWLQGGQIIDISPMWCHLWHFVYLLHVGLPPLDWAFYGQGLCGFAF